MKSKTVLLTAFEPFGGDPINPSAEIVRALDGRVIARHAVAGAILPCAFGAAPRVLARLRRRHEPDLVICLGLAAGRDGITPERVAINIADARLPDNAGAQPEDAPVVRGGPAAYWSRLPIRAIVDALRAGNIPAAVSSTAGTYVCNHVFYALMHALRRTRSVRAGFIHVPQVPEQAKPGEPSLPLAVMIDGVSRAIEVALTARTGKGATRTEK